MKTVKKSSNILFIVLFIILAVYAISLFVLLGWGIIKSLQSETDFILQGGKAWSMPQDWTIDNYLIAFESIKYTIPLDLGGGDVYFDEMLLNSVIYAGVCTLLTVFCDCSVAYLTTKINNKFNRVINFIVYFKMLIPLYGTMPANIKLLTNLGVMDSFMGMFLMTFCFGGTNFLLFQAAFKSLSNDYIEAAIIDGASQFSIMFKICFPLIRTTIGVLFITLFVTRWNDYMTPLIYLRKNPTAAYGLHYLDQKGNTSYHSYIVNKIAGFYIFIIPTLLIFLFAKDKLMGNLTVGGVKG